MIPDKALQPAVFVALVTIIVSVRPCHDHLFDFLIQSEPFKRFLDPFISLPGSGTDGGARSTTGEAEKAGDYGGEKKKPVWLNEMHSIRG